MIFRTINDGRADDRIRDPRLADMFLGDTLGLMHRVCRSAVCSDMAEIDKASYPGSFRSLRQVASALDVDCQ